MKPAITFTPIDNDDNAAFFHIPNCTELEHEEFIGFLKENNVTVFSPPSELETFKIHQDLTQEEGDELVSKHERLISDVESQLRKV